MNKILLIAFCSCVIFSVSGQKKAISETGDEVLLYDDGTWKYVDEEEVESKEIPLNPKKFKKNKQSSFLLKSSKINLGFWLNPKEWSFKKAEDNPDAEYEMQLKDGDLYGMVITEKFEIPLETLKSIAFENGKGAAPDLRIVKEEYRMVNGLKVLLMRMDGTMQGIKFSFYGYYYSNENGTIQFITYTAQSLLDNYLDVSENLLNGLVEVEE